MLNQEAVLFANERFYIAFARQDMDAMSELWARHAPILCIHPGWQALFGRENILQSWRQIFSSENPPAITASQSQVLMYPQFTTVLCYERIMDQSLVALNAFVEENGEIRMVQHQAGHCLNMPVAKPGPYNQVH